MAIDILGSLDAILAGAPRRKLGELLGEPQEGVRSGLRGALPALLARLVQRARDPRGASALLGRVAHPRTDAGITTNLLGALGDRGSFDALVGGGEDALGSLLGARSHATSQAIAQVAGVNPSSASRLLALAVPLLLGVLKKQVVDRQLDAGGCSRCWPARPRRCAVRGSTRGSRARWACATWTRGPVRSPQAPRALRGRWPTKRRRRGPSPRRPAPGTGAGSRGL
jgi:hypothetical protein